jgi:hypothetical protein
VVEDLSDGAKAGLLDEGLLKVGLAERVNANVCVLGCRVNDNHFKILLACEASDEHLRDFVACDEKTCTDE